MHVLRRGIDGLETGERRLHLGKLRVVEDPGTVQAVRVHERRLDVVRQQLGVVRLEELPHLRCELGAYAARPERHSPPLPSSSAGASRWRCRDCASIARESAMSLICTASWPMRSPAVKAVVLRSMLSRSGSYVTASPCVSRIV